MSHERNADPRVQDDRPVWGVKAISEVINRNERQTYYLCSKGLIPVTKIGDQWTGIPSRLLRAVSGEAA